MKNIFTTLFYSSLLITIVLVIGFFVFQTELFLIAMLCSFLLLVGAIIPFLFQEKNQAREEHFEIELIELKESLNALKAQMAQLDNLKNEIINNQQSISAIRMRLGIVK